MRASRGVVLVLISRAARTFPLGILGVLLPVYLAAIGSAVFVGLFFSLSAFSSLVVLLLLGTRGHRIKVRNVLIIQSLLFSSSLLIMALSPLSSLLLIAAATSVTNWAPGGGSGTGGGAYNTSVNILLSENSDENSRTLALSLSSLVGVVSFAIGAFFLSGLNISKSELVIAPLTLTSFEVRNPATLFAISAVVQFFAAIILLFVRNRGPQGDSENESNQAEPDPGLLAQGSAISVLRQASWLVVAEFSNGFGNGMFTQLVPLWFYLRFGISLASVATIFFALGLFTAFVVLISPRLESRMGSINAIFLARAMSSILLAGTVFAPTLITALVPYFVSVLLARVSLPIQQSFVFARIGRGEWTRASSMVATANVVGTALGPTVGAFLLLDVSLGLPFLVASPFILISAWIYRTSFRLKAPSMAEPGIPIIQPVGQPVSWPRRLGTNQAGSST